MRRLPLLVLVAACGGDSSKPAVDAPSDIDAAIDGAGPACGAAGPAEMTCGGACVDTSSDPQHCGDCTTTCSGGTASCAGGMCVAPLTTVWEHHFGGDDFGYYATGTAVDGAGNVYVTGAMQNTVDFGGGGLTTAGGQDIYVASYAPTGAFRWAKRFGSTGGDQGADISVVGTTLYVTGSFTGMVDFGGTMLTSAGADDIFVLAMATGDGSVASARGFGTTGGDAGLGIVADAAGNVTIGGFFATGTMDVGGGNTLTGPGALNAFVVSLTATGTHRWSRRLSSAAMSLISSCQAVTIDPMGNITVAGTMEGTTDFGGGMVTSAGMSDAFVASYTSTGGFRWARLFGATQSDNAEGVAADANGNIVVGGGFHGMVNFGTGPITQTGVVDGFVAMLEAATGSTRWAKNLGAATSGVVIGVRADAQGNAVAVGHIEGAANLGTGALAPLGQYDIIVAGYDKTTGTARFARRYGGTDFDGASGLALAQGGAMAISGEFRATADLGKGAIAGGAADNAYVMLLAP